MPRQKVLLGLTAKFQTWTLAVWLWPSPDSQLSKLSFRGAPSSTTPCPSPPPGTSGLPDLYVWVTVQVLGAGGALDGPAPTGVNNFRFHGLPSSTSTAPPHPLTPQGCLVSQSKVPCKVWGQGVRWAGLRALV